MKMHVTPAKQLGLRSQRLGGAAVPTGDFPKIRVHYVGVLIIRILLIRVLY